MTRLTKPLLYSSSMECEQAFYEALEAADADAVVELWLNDDDVCCIHPGGARLLGLAAVMGSWRTILSNGPVNIRAVSSQALETPTMAVHNVVEEVMLTQGARQKLVHVVATNVYLKTPAGWKMVLHHASPATEAEAVEVQVPSGPLH